MADLTDLGLTEYESRAYRALLEVGPATARDLSDASDVPMGRIYDVLGSVESRQLVRSQTASRPKKYVAVDPDTAVERLLGDRKRELEAKAEQYESVASSLRRDLESPPEPEAGFWTAEVGAADSLDLLLERIDAAEETVHVVSGAPAAPSLDLRAASNRISERVLAALERGVTVRALLSPNLLASLPATVSDQYTAALDGYRGFEARVGDAVYGDVTLLDGAEVCVGLPNPIDPDEAFALVDLTDPEFAAQVQTEFERGWADAERVVGEA